MPPLTTRRRQLALAVTQPPEPTYSISVSPSTSAASVMQGGSVNVVYTITRPSGYTSVVTPTAGTLPSGVSVVFTPTTFTGATTQITGVYTATAGATVVGATSFPVTFSGAGVADFVVVGTLAVTAASSSSRGVFNYLNIVKGTDFQSFADTAALLAEIPWNESDSSKQKLLTVSSDSGASPASCISLAISPITGLKVMRITIDNTHGPPNSTQMWFAGYPGMPTTNRTGGVSTPFTDIAIYSEVSYSPGFTTAGSDSGGQGFKQYAGGYANANGRFGLEWEYVSSNTYTIGWNDNGNGNKGDVGSNGSTTISPNGDPRPWNATGPGGLWTTPQILCCLTEMRTVDSNTVTQRSRSWLKGTNPTTNWQLDATVNCGGGVLPTVNRAAWCENFNMRRGFRFMPDDGYIDYHFIGVVDLTYDPNPANL